MICLTPHALCIIVISIGHAIGLHGAQASKLTRYFISEVRRLIHAAAYLLVDRDSNGRSFVFRTKPGGFDDGS